MNEPYLQLAKREMQRFFAPRGVWIATLAAGVLLGLMAPFDTGSALSLAPRIVYWVVIASTTFLTGTIISTCLIAWSDATKRARWLGIGAACVLSGVVIFAQVSLINLALFQRLPVSLGLLAANIFAATVVITVTYAILHPGFDTQPDLPSVTAPRLLSRLPLQKRGPLVSISVQDHYVDITTTKGSEMILLRFRDAVAETAPTPGLQIHRSHWVARDQIKAVQRKAGKTVVTLPDDRDLPVSRSFLPALREAGLLPARTG